MTPKPPPAYVDEALWSSEAPTLPRDRPPTRLEVWDYVKHFYQDTKTPDELRTFAARWYVSTYALWVAQHAWRLPPDWREGDPPAPTCRPSTSLFPAGRPDIWPPNISRLLSAAGRPSLKPTREDDTL